VRDIAFQIDWKKGFFKYFWWGKLTSEIPLQHDPQKGTSSEHLVLIDPSDFKIGQRV
jgi:hypothetical protein